MHYDQLTAAEAGERWRLHQAAELLREAGFVETASGEWVLPAELVEAEEGEPKA